MCGIRGCTVRCQKDTVVMEDDLFKDLIHIIFRHSDCESDFVFIFLLCFQDIYNAH